MQFWFRKVWEKKWSRFTCNVNRCTHNSMLYILLQLHIPWQCRKVRLVHFFGRSTLARLSILKAACRQTRPIYYFSATLFGFMMTWVTLLLSNANKIQICRCYRIPLYTLYLYVSSPMLLCTIAMRHDAWHYRFPLSLRLCCHNIAIMWDGMTCLKKTNTSNALTVNSLSTKLKISWLSS